jgi:hypothetical protein
MNKVQELMLVYTVETFAEKHQMTTTDVLELFSKHQVLERIIAEYEVLHTQDPDECVGFAEDVVGYEHE